MTTIRAFIFDVRDFGFRVALANLRFVLGYRIGGFTSAQRQYGDSE